MGRVALRSCQRGDAPREDEDQVVFDARRCRNEWLVRLQREVTSWIDLEGGISSMLESDVEGAKPEGGTIVPFGGKVDGGTIVTSACAVDGGASTASRLVVEGGASITWVRSEWDEHRPVGTSVR